MLILLGVLKYHNIFLEMDKGSEVPREKTASVVVHD